MLDNLGNVLTLMCLVIVVGCGLWGLAARAVARRRLAAIRREFGVVPDEQLLLGLADLAAAVKAQRQQEQSQVRDVHVRNWR